MTEQNEIELKLEVDEESAATLATLPWLREVPADARRLVATYYDTPERDLLAAGFTLRVRSDGDRHVQTIKATGSAAGLFVRPEWESEVEDARPRLDLVAGPMAPLVTPELLQRLQPSFASEVERVVRVVDHGEAVVEIAIDRGVVGTGTREVPVCEVELELRAGSPAALFSVARRLNERVPVRLGVLSKSERGVRLADDKAGRAVKAEPVELTTEMDAAAAFRAIAQNCIRQFRLNEAMLKPDAAPAVLHQARVGLRRLRSAFSLFAPLFAGDATGERLATGLHHSAAVLGEARDLDVLAETVDAIEPRLADARAAARVAALAELGGARHRALMIDLAEWLAIGDWLADSATAEQRTKPLPLVVATILDQARRRVKRRGRKLEKLDDEGRHRVRIATKKLRYATDFLASLAGEDKQARRYDRFARAVERLQEHLGDLNDAATAPALAARFGLAPPPARDRDKAIAAAARAYDELIDAKRFWR